MQSAPRTHGAAPPSPVTRPLLHISSWEGVGTSASYPSLALRAIQDKLDGGVDNKTLPETQQTNLRGGAHHFVTKDPTNPLSVGALSPFRESYWDKIRTLNVQRNHQIIHEARQQLEKMLGESDARFIALGILSSLNRTQMVLLSCATVTGGQDFFALANCRKSRVWRDEERTCFCLKFTSFVPGRWYMEDILDVWEEFFKILFDSIRILRAGDLGASFTKNGSLLLGAVTETANASRVLSKALEQHMDFESRGNFCCTTIAETVKKGRPEVVIGWKLVDQEVEFNLLLN